jgi:hypothetical protein|tara:strand:- start:892 stop:1014 length:123 start_codon:yes stop_codon:yes gene_type:complete
MKDRGSDRRQTKRRQYEAGYEPPNRRNNKERREQKDRRET